MTEQGPSIPERVVLTVIDLAGGGTQKIVAGLALTLAGAGCHVTIVTNRTADDRWSRVTGFVELVELPGRIQIARAHGVPSVFRNVRWLIRAALTVRRVVRSAGSGTPVLAFLPGTNALTTIACLGFRIPLVLSERNDVTRQGHSPALRIARRALYRRASVLTTNRPDDVAALESLAGRVPVRVIRNPPPRTGGDAEPSAARRILSIGRLAPHKRHRDVVAAFSEMAAAFPDWTLRILGDGPERAALERQVQLLGLEGRVELPGWTSDIGAELTEGALLVHASEHEGTANAIIEAMGAGLPVIASESSAPPGAGSGRMREHPAVTVFPTGDVAALALMLGELLRDDAKRAECGRAARRAAGHLVAEPLQEWLPVIATDLHRRIAET